MPLAHRIIPVLLKRGDTLVKGVRFKSWRSVGHALQAARIHQARGVDELVILDVDATPKGLKPDFKAIEKLTKNCFVPLTVGGGITTVQDVRDLMNAGADKVVVETAWISDPGFLPELASKVGSQAIVASISSSSGYASIHCGSVVYANAVEVAAKQAVKEGAGEILLQSVERDGTMNGYDLNMIKAVSKVKIPVIASCGCGSYADMVKAIEAGASAVAAGAFFLFTDHTPRGAAQYLIAHGFEARLPK